MLLLPDGIEQNLMPMIECAKSVGINSRLKAAIAYIECFALAIVVFSFPMIARVL